MINLQETFKSVLPALVVSSVISLVGSVSSQKIDKRLLEDNIQATQELSKAMQDLRYLMGVFSERYVTREELERRVTEERGTSNGS